MEIEEHYLLSVTAPAKRNISLRFGDGQAYIILYHKINKKTEFIAKGVKVGKFYKIDFNIDTSSESNFQIFGTEHFFILAILIYLSSLCNGIDLNINN